MILNSGSCSFRRSAPAISPVRSTVVVGGSYQAASCANNEPEGIFHFLPPLSQLFVPLMIILSPEAHMCFPRKPSIRITVLLTTRSYRAKTIYAPEWLPAKWSDRCRRCCYSLCPRFCSPPGSYSLACPTQCRFCRVWPNYQGQQISHSQERCAWDKAHCQQVVCAGPVDPIFLCLCCCWGGLGSAGGGNHNRLGQVSFREKKAEVDLLTKRNN